MVIGLAVSGAILLIVGRTDDPLVEITLTTIAAYGSFLLAEHFGRIRHHQRADGRADHRQLRRAGFLSSAGRERVARRGNIFAFVANSFVFILIGMNVANQPLSELGSAARGSRNRAWCWPDGPVDLSARRAVPLLALARCRRHASTSLFWGGLRGALALALALAVPATRSRAQRDHRHRVRGRRFLDPRSGADDAVADQAIRPGRNAGGGGCRFGRRTASRAG